MFLGLDVGTSGVKAIIIAADGGVQAQEAAPLAVSRPQVGWSEQAPEDWWNAAETAVLALPAEFRAQVLGIGIAGQMHGAIGFTREHRLHLYTTSLYTWRDEFGGQVMWAKLLGAAAIDAGAAGYWPMVTQL